MPNPERKPSVAAAAQRGDFVSWDNSSIHAPLRATQTWPGRPSPGANMIVRRHLLKEWETCADSVPERHTPKLVYSLFESPKRSDVPVQALADDFQNQGNRLGQRIDLGQHSSRGILNSKSPLVILAAGDIVEDDHSPLDLTLVIPQGSGIDQHP